MATSYYDMTGVLVLDKVTPVIKALFGVYALDDTQFDNGKAYIADVAGAQDCSWTSVLDGLLALAAGLGLDVDGMDAEPDEEVEAAISMLATYFNADGNTDLLNLIEHTDFEETADLHDLLTIARAFDDGHGLKGFMIEAAWHSDRPRLFEFGGAGTYQGIHFATSASSRQATHLGQTVEEALAAGDTDAAAKILAVKVQGLINGVQSAAVRADVHQKVMQLLTADSIPA